MNRRPTITHIAPDAAELRKRQAKRCQVDAFRRRMIAQAREEGFRCADLSSAFIQAGVDLAENGAGASSCFGKAMGRRFPELPSVSAVEAAERVFGPEGQRSVLAQLGVRREGRA